MLIAPLDSAESARSVREETAELANYFLSDNKDARGIPFIRRARSASSSTLQLPLEPSSSEHSLAPLAEVIAEVSEPPSPEETDDRAVTAEGPSMLTTMLRRSPPDQSYFYKSKDANAHEDITTTDNDTVEDEGEASLNRVASASPQPAVAARDSLDETEPNQDESSPLLPPTSRETGPASYGTSRAGDTDIDLEGQKALNQERWVLGAATSMRNAGGRVASIIPVISNPKRWDRHALWRNAVVAPVACLPAVVVGLLLNILDALSYGKYGVIYTAICFP